MMNQLNNGVLSAPVLQPALIYSTIFDTSLLACCSPFAELLISLAGQNVSNCNIQRSWNKFSCTYKYWWISNQIRSWWASAPTSAKRWSVSKEGRPNMCPERPQLLRLHLARFPGAYVKIKHTDVVKVNSEPPPPSKGMAFWQYSEIVWHTLTDTARGRDSHPLFNQWVE